VRKTGEATFIPDRTTNPYALTGKRFIINRRNITNKITGGIISGRN
jgi:hypothetical protein